ncbi:MAG: hypothetical protein ACWA5W_02055 [Phycisphaerales bacterium]
MSMLSLSILSMIMLLQPEPAPSPIEPLPEITVERWSDPMPLVGTTINLDDQGVSIRSAQQIIPLRVPWFDVEGIEPTPAAYPSMKHIADLAWRSHQRLQRGDFTGAEIVYRQLESKYLWGIGEQSVDVAHGLLLCRLDRGDRIGAITPAIAWLSASTETLPIQSGINLDHTNSQAQSYGLIPQLPPVFGSLDVGTVDFGDHLTTRPLRIRVIAEIYQLATERDQYITPAMGDRLDSLADRVQEIRSQSDGIDFMLDMLICQAHPDPDRRMASRRQLKNRTRSQRNTWGEAWARLALGSAMIHENEPLLNEQGVIQLVHIIVRMKHDQPEIALLAAQIANDYLADTQRASWGQALIVEANRSQ